MHVFQQHIPTGLLKRMQILLLGFSLFMLLSTIPDLLSGTPPAGYRLAAVLLVMLLGWRWITWYRTGTAQHADIVVEGTAIALLALAIPDPARALAVAYVGLCYRASFGTVQWKAASLVAVATGLLAGDAAGVTIGGSGITGEVVGHLPGLVFATILGGFLTQVARSHERMTAELASSEKRHRQLVEQLPKIVYTASLDGTINYISPQVEPILGYTPEECLDGVYALTQAYVHPDDQEHVLRITQESLETGSTLVLDFRAQARSGDWVWLHIRANPIRDENGEPLSWLGTITDTTRRKMLEAQLEHRATHDWLTELPNRALFRDRLQHAINRLERNGRPLAVLFLDLDNFKLVNDSLGHNNGDSLLQEVAQRLTKAVRKGDTVSRLGGDEFTLLLEDVNGTDRAIAVADRILAELDDDFQIAGRRFAITASVGIVVSEPNNAEPDELIRRADVAMYEAKRRGGDQYVTYTTAIRDDVVERLELGNDLRRAIDNDELVIHYQPVVDLASGALREVEALVHWQHPQRGLLGPTAFLALAEDRKLIAAVDRWVLRRACRQLRAWQRDYPEHADLRVSVNLSPSRLRDPAFAEYVARTLAETGLQPEHLKLEITEQAMLDDIEQAADTLTRLSELGVQIAIDDFGTGNSALSYLLQFPIDALKIDGSFITGMNAGSPKADMVRGLVNLARSLGLSVTAEGIEADEYLQLRSFGCELGQGYRFARPQPPEEFSALLDRSTPLTVIMAQPPDDWIVIPAS